MYNYHNYQLFKLIIFTPFMWQFYWLECFSKTGLPQIDLRIMEIPVVRDRGYSLGGNNLRILFGRILTSCSRVFCFVLSFISIKGRDCFNILNWVFVSILHLLHILQIQLKHWTQECTFQCQAPVSWISESWYLRPAQKLRDHLLKT